MRVLLCLFLVGCTFDTSSSLWHRAEDECKKRGGIFRISIYSNKTSIMAECIDRKWTHSEKETMAKLK